jgi:hypothetical protein
VLEAIAKLTRMSVDWLMTREIKQHEASFDF